MVSRFLAVNRGGGGNIVPLYHIQVMKDSWAYNFETM